MYLLVLAFVPALMRCGAAALGGIVVALLAASALVDGARLATGAIEWGFPNFLVVWLIPVVIGVAYARRMIPARFALAAAAVAFVAAVAAVVVGVLLNRVLASVTDSATLAPSTSDKVIGFVIGLGTMMALTSLTQALVSDPSPFGELVRGADATIDAIHEALYVRRNDPDAPPVRLVVNGQTGRVHGEAPLVAAHTGTASASTVARSSSGSALGVSTSTGTPSNSTRIVDTIVAAKREATPITTMRTRLTLIPNDAALSAPKVKASSAVE